MESGRRNRERDYTKGIRVKVQGKKDWKIIFLREGWRKK